MSIGMVLAWVTLPVDSADLATPKFVRGTSLPRTSGGRASSVRAMSLLRADSFLGPLDSGAKRYNGPGNSADVANALGVSPRDRFVRRVNFGLGLAGLGTLANYFILRFATSLLLTKQ